jgi:hypothetical protein
MTEELHFAILVTENILSLESVIGGNKGRYCLNGAFRYAALHAPPISFFSILSPAQNWVRSTDIRKITYETILNGFIYEIASPLFHCTKSTFSPQ